MPVDRFFHPRAGHSEKVTLLSDFEFRVWWTYQMAADDYGVMRCAAVTIQAANDALAKRSPRSVTLALHKLITVGLLLPFTHQHRAYVCQGTWQDFQKIKYPRESAEPIPPAEVLTMCSDATKKLFVQRFGKIPEIVLKDSPNVSETFPKSSPNVSETFSEISFARAREEANANGLRLKANGSATELVASVSAAEIVMEAFRGHWKRVYGYECSLLLKPLEFMHLEEQITAHSQAQLLTAMSAYFATDDAYVRNAKHPLALFLRDPLKYLAKDQTPAKLSKADEAAAVLAIVKRRDAGDYS